MHVYDNTFALQNIVISNLQTIAAFQKLRKHNTRYSFELNKKVKTTHK